MKVQTVRSIQLLCVLLFFVSCKNSPSDFSSKAKGSSAKMNDAHWLIGSWQAVTTKGITYEKWHKASDTLFMGESFFIKEGDTVLNESIKIVARDNDVAFISTVPDQNEGLPVTFKLTYIDPHKMVFENQTHDFPQMITYQEVTQDSLIAEISGTIKGDHRSKRFPMKRLP